MIKRLDIIGVHVQVDEDMRRYVQRKIGRLDKYVSKKSRQSLHAEVRLKEAKSKEKKECTCEITLYLPQDVINVGETTINMYAAVDIVETKLKGKLKKYKDTHAYPKLRRRLLVHLHRPLA